MPDGEEREVKATLKFEDEYTEGVKQASKETDRMDKSLEDVQESSLEANIAFMATLDAVDKLGGGVAKIRGGLEDLGIVNEQTAETLRKVEGAADLVVGTAEIAIVTMAGWTRATEGQRNALLGLGAAAAAAGLAFAAVNAETEEAKAVYSALTGVAAGLAAAEFTLAAAKMAGWVAGAGPLSPAMAAVIAGALVAASAAAATYWASTKETASAQMGEGQEKVFMVEEGGDVRPRRFAIDQTGEIQLHAGEEATITRRGAPAEVSPIEQPRAPLIGVVNFNGWFSPLDPRGQRRAAEALALIVDLRNGRIA